MGKLTLGGHFVALVKCANCPWKSDSTWHISYILIRITKPPHPPSPPPLLSSSPLPAALQSSVAKTLIQSWCQTMLRQIALSKCQIACHCITCLLLQNLAEPGITLRNMKEIWNSCKNILFWTFLLFYFDLIKNIIIVCEGQHVCVYESDRHDVKAHLPLNGEFCHQSDYWWKIGLN